MPGTDSMNHALTILEIAATFSAIGSVLLMTSATMRAKGLLDRLCSMPAMFTVLLMGFALWTFAQPRTQVQMASICLAAVVATLALAVFGAKRKPKAEKGDEKGARGTFRQ